VAGRPGAAVTSARTARFRAHDDNGGVVDVDDAEFERLVEEALDSIPPELGAVMSNVVVLVADEAPPGEDLLGLYEGIPLTERDGWYAGVLPDTITIYRLPILRICATREDVVDEVRTTVIHEVAHHFGIDDDALHEMGWG
jgi:predicted Zn-dependent protease with MMP-like domain